MVTKTNSEVVLDIIRVSPVRWNLHLACGHVQQLTTKTPPKRKRMFCRACDDADKGKK